MDRAFIERQLKVAIEMEPLLANASEEYKERMAINWTHHLAGNWEMVEQADSIRQQIAERQAAMVLR